MEAQRTSGAEHTLKKIVLLINGVIKVLSLTWHELTGMDGVLGTAPSSRTFDNEWQLLRARLGGDGATCKGLASPPILALFPSQSSLSVPNTLVFQF